jgi:hypothetical protein
MSSERDEGRPPGRADSRKFERNRLLWTAPPESPQLEPRTMLSLTVTSYQIPEVELVQPSGIATNGTATANAGQGLNTSAVPRGNPDATGKSHDRIQQTG